MDKNLEKGRARAYREGSDTVDKDEEKRRIQLTRT